VMRLVRSAAQAERNLGFVERQLVFENGDSQLFLVEIAAEAFR
jgi:hypothetical protein